MINPELRVNTLTQCALFKKTFYAYVHRQQHIKTSLIVLSSHHIIF